MAPVHANTPQPKSAAKAKSISRRPPRSTMLTPQEPDKSTTMKMLAQTNRYPLLFVDPKTCVHCKQTPHSLEKDNEQKPNKQIYCWWAKTSRHADDMLHPSGSECGTCTEVRERNYIKGTTVDKLMDLLTDAAEEQRFERLRSNRVKGIMEDPVDRPNLKNSIKVEDSQFNAAKDRGHFYSMVDFVKTRNLVNFKNFEELTTYITETLQFKVGYGETGDYGVFVSSLPPGAAYYYEDGVNHVRKQSQTECCESVTQARRQFEELCGKTTTAPPPSAIDMAMLNGSAQAAASCVTQTISSARPASAGVTELDVDSLNGDEAFFRGGARASPQPSES